MSPRMDADPNSPRPSCDSVPSSFESKTMTRATRRVLAVLLLAAPALQSAPLAAQDSAPKIPVRQLGPVEAKSEAPIVNVSSLRALSNGNVIVNDGRARQVLMFDASLKLAKVISDTLEAAIPYGQRNMGMIPYVDDSTLLVDPATLSLLVLDQRGEMVRVMAAPRTNDINQLAGMNLGSNAFDSEGRLIYRIGGGGGFGGFGGGGFGGDGGRGGRGGGAPGGGRGGAPAAPPAASGASAGAAAGATSTAAQQGAQARARVASASEDPQVASGRNSAQITVNGERRTRSFNNNNLPDSVPILRANFDTRSVDTVTFVRVTNPKFNMSTTPEGGMQVAVTMNPLPQNDDWALMADGTVAVVRVLDYRVDWFKADGTLERSAPLPFDWKRITDDEKIRMVDSLKTAAKEATERAQQLMGGPRGFRPSFAPVEPELLPDYYPPIRAGSTLADRDGNLWILPATSSLAGQLMGMIPGGRGGPPGGIPGMPAAAPQAGGLAYDIVNRKGELVERIQLPAGRSIAGFGPDGVVYLTAREGRTMFLEKVRRLPAP
jgi:hypothetical protein